MNAKKALSELYQLTRTAPALTVQLPSELGCGNISCLTTTNGISLSNWSMCYERDAQVSGKVGGDLRLLFCLGEGVVWHSCNHNHAFRLDPWEACLCLGDGSDEAMCYGAGAQFAFHAINIPRSYAVSLLSQYFSETDVAEITQELNGRRFLISRELKAMLSTFHHLSDITDRFAMMRAEGVVHELLAICMRDAMGEHQNRLRPDDAELVRAVKERIDREYTSAPSISTLAHDYGVSPSKLTGDFKKQYGMPLHAYIIECRLCEAARLLCTGMYTVGEVAETVGYVKAGQFSEAFRRRFGVLPREY